MSAWRLMRRGGGAHCANTQAVTAIHPVPHEFVVQQIDTLFADVQIDAVKIGMLGQQRVTRQWPSAWLTGSPPIWCWIRHVPKAATIF